MKKVYSVFASLLFFVFICIAPQTSPASRDATSVTASDNTETTQTQISFSEFAFIINQLAVDDTNYDKQTLAAFKPINEALKTSDYTAYSLIENNNSDDDNSEDDADEEETLTVVLHKEDKNKRTDKTFPLNEKNSKELTVEILYFLQQGKTPNRHRKGPLTPQNTNDKNNQNDNRYYDDENEDEERDEPARRANQTKSKTSQKPANKGLPDKTGIGNRMNQMYPQPRYHQPMRHYPPAPRPGNNQANRTSMVDKIGFVQEGKPKPGKQPSYQDIKSISVQGATQIAGSTQTRIPESETYTRRTIKPSSQPLDHTRRTARTSRLVIKDEKQNQTAPIKTQEKQTFFNRASEWFSSIFTTIKSWFSK